MDEVIENLSEHETDFISNRFNKERKLTIYIGLIFLFFALAGPYLPLKIPHASPGAKPAYFPSVLAYMAVWGLIYLIPLRKLRRLKRDRESQIKIKTLMRVIKKEISKGTVATTYTIRVEGENKEVQKFELSQDVYEKLAENESIFITYTPYSKAVLEVHKGEELLTVCL